MASIEKRGKNSYRLLVELGYDNAGKRIKRSKTIKASGIREAEKELAKFQVEVESGEYITPEKLTFESFYKEWEAKYGSKHLEAKTLETYEHLLKNHILPAIGHKRLEDITPLHIASLLKALESENARKDGKSGGLSTTSIRFIHRVLKDILDRAVEWRVIKSNPVSSIKRPKIQEASTKVYNTDEVLALLDALEGEPEHWRILITLALTTGLRRGEILALEWKHLNFDEGYIDVVQSLSYIKKKHVIKMPKNKSSIRKVSIPSNLLLELNHFKEKSQEQQQQLGELWEGGNHSFVFTSWNGKPYYPTAPGTWLRRFLKRKKLSPIRFHDLRHTSATMLINQGVHAKTIANRLGHADIRTTMNTYGHALQSVDQAAANTFNSILIKR